MSTNPFAAWLDNKSLSEKLYTALAWPPSVYNSVAFPYVIAAINYADASIEIVLRFRDNTEELRLTDPAREFPSQTLLAQMNVLAGSEASRLRASHRRDVAKRVEKNRLRDKYSSRPW